MIELAAYLLSWPVLGAMTAVMLAQMLWQAYRVYTGPFLLGFNAFVLIALPVAALWPPFDYPSLTYRMQFALLMIPAAIIAAVFDPPRFKILSIGHLIFAVLFMYVLIQAAR